MTNSNYAAEKLKQSNERAHRMERKSAPGHGSWRQCRNCGGPYHGGYWWHGGYKSKEVTPCDIYLTGLAREKWMENAIPIYNFNDM